MIRGLWIVAVVLFVACSATKPDTSATSQGSSSVQPTDAGMGGASGSAIVSSGVSTSSSISGGAGGEGGVLPPHPIDCSKLNPGITCVEDNDCPPMTKEQLAACGPWKCVLDPPPDPDAGIAGKKGCILSQ